MKTKLHILVLPIFAAALIISGSGCSGGGGDSSDTTANYNRQRVGAANSSATEANSSGENADLSPADREKQARVRQKAQEFVAENYAGWTLKGTSDIAKSPVDLHLTKDAEEKVVKVNYKEFSDLGGQPYIVLSKIAENDLSEKNQEEKPSPSLPAPGNEKTQVSPSPSGN